MKTSGLASTSQASSSRKSVDGFASDEISLAPVASKRARADDDLQAALAMVDLGGDDTASVKVTVNTAPAVLGDLAHASGEPLWIEVDRMSVWEGNPRHVIDPIKLTQLADSIEEHGQSDPVDLVENPDRPGHYLILGGQRRWMVVKQRNLQEGKLLARVRPGMPSAEVMFAAAITTQVNTDPLQDLDYAISLARVKDSIGVRALSKVIDKSASEISKLRSIGDLPATLMAYLKENSKKFSSLFAYEVVQVNTKMGEKQAIDFAKMIVARSLSHKATVMAKEKLFGERQPLRRSSWNIIRLPTGGSMRIKEDTGDLALSLKGLSADGIETIQKAVKKAMESADKPTT